MNKVWSAAALVVASIIIALSEPLTNWIVPLCTGMMTAEAAQTLIAWAGTAVVFILAFAVVLGIASLFGVRFNRDRREQPTPEHDRRWEDTQDGPIDAYAVSRTTLEHVIQQIVSDSIRTTVNGQIRRVEDKVDANVAAVTSLGQSVTRVHERIDSVFELLTQHATRSGQ